jgi:hypothetical protein
MKIGIASLEWKGVKNAKTGIGALFPGSEILANLPFLLKPVSKTP